MTREEAAARQRESVAELQGLYGAFTFPEKVLQKIWADGEFEREALRTIDGRAVQVIAPGKWNLLGGPDFKGARLKIGEEPERMGDVELHLHAEDWATHRHADDAAYRDVILHVVLFPPRADHVTRGARGPIAVAALLPLLWRDLESYAEDAAVESLADQPLDEALRAWASEGGAPLLERLREWAKSRWERKRRDAARRIERLGWTEACHHAALEILGYRFNRVPMLRVASRWPLAAWAEGEVDAETAWANEREQWSLQGVRPANHPRGRLRQYATWTRARPRWPDVLADVQWPANRDVASGGTKAFRKALRLTAQRDELAERIAARSVGGTRWDTLVCDGWLPLLAARSGADLFAWWWHWFPGDLPETQVQALRRVGAFDARAQPACQGALQGLLAWRLAREASAVGRGA